MRFAIVMSIFALFSVISAFKFNEEFLHLKRADTTTSSKSLTRSLTLSKSDTTVWVTITTNGALATVKTIWTQGFMSTYTTATALPSSGDIGMGSLSGSVGGIRSYSQTTISNEGNRNVVYRGVFGAAVMVLGML